ncbi:MAG: M20/M25/M40 family metallo-hydrolase, partial [Gemmatimonadetes bacterium]|nr:M20/M25/M40 family metallo-hydrolase [Gemmatimonadota bacterium]
MRSRLVVALLALATRLSAQEPVDQATIARIKDEGLNRSQVGELFNHLTNVIGPRLTGSPAFKQAVEWSEARFRQFGLANVHTEAWPFGRGWTLEKLTLEITEPRYFPLVGYPEAWTPSTAGELLASPVYVGDWTPEQVRARKSELAGKIVLPWRPQTAFITQERPQPTEHQQPVRIGAPPNVGTTGPVERREIGALMREVGAAAVLHPDQGQHGTIFVLGNRNTPDDAVPSVILAAEHYNLIARMLQAGVPVKLRMNVQTRYYAADTNGYNVIAEIPGTDRRIGDEVVMVGAHLDSWHSATGATDNADASASLIEAARILKAASLQPRRTIRFALWGGEEQGLLGARAYVQQHLAGDANAQAREKFSVYFNHDPGTGPIYGWYLEESGAVSPIFDAWLEPLKDLGARRNIADKIGSTDHLAFIAAGLPGFNTVQDYTDYDTRTHHTNTDFYERLKLGDLKQAAIVLATFAYQAAM